MQVTQTYARPSTATMQPDGLRLDVSAELSRPKVALEAMIRDSLAYARVMLALYDVVSGDYRAKKKDHTAYQEWVQQRYLEELSGEMAAGMRKMPGLMARRDALRERVTELQRAAQPLERKLATGDFYKAKRAYFDWLAKHHWAAWLILDPVVSVHPDGVIFEVFSIDESSYGRVTVPMEKLDVFGQTIFGTTNIDFSKRLADEIRRVRSYRPAWLQVGGEGVTIATGAGEAVEKKIDLPPSWVRGFLQVQSAAAFSGTDLTLSAATVAEVLAVLRRQREKEGPRSLKFTLRPGETPTITVEPWNITIREAAHAADVPYEQEIRIWGRRRLFSLESLLPHAEKVQVRLLGTGMPSYWTVFQQSHRFDLGLSGWTQNDWSRSARFDLLASTAPVSDEHVASVASALERSLRASPEEMAAQTGLAREAATAALQRLCREGRAMYDLAANVYRWRQLLPFPAEINDEADQRLRYARRLIENNAVRFLKPGEEDEEGGGFGHAAADEPTTRHRAQVKGEKRFDVTLELDADGRVRFANCTCAWHRREKLRKGPCAHILATSALASQQTVAPVTRDKTGSAATVRPDRFKGQNWVFTGALTRFTREQAESLIAAGGGKTAGSVSRNTSFVVAGEKAGSKLAKARDLNIPVLTEAEFEALIKEDQ